MCDGCGVEGEGRLCVMSLESRHVYGFRRSRVGREWSAVLMVWVSWGLVAQPSKRVDCTPCICERHVLSSVLDVSQ